MNKTPSYIWLLIGFGVLLALSGGTLIGVSPLLKKIGNAIATAEGYFDAGPTRPKRNNNPGDIKADLIGKATGIDPEGFAIFATEQDGFENLYKEISLILSGQSQYYRPDMTLSQIGMIYGNDPNWGVNVANVLGVSPDTPLNEVTA